MKRKQLLVVWGLPLRKQVSKADVPGGLPAAPESAVRIKWVIATSHTPSSPGPNSIKLTKVVKKYCKK